MHEFLPRLDILPPAQRRLWSQLSAATSMGMTLYGGTAIALRLGHRQSVDFDFFTERPLQKEALRAAMPWLGTATVLQDRPNTLTVLAGHDPRPVKVSFFGDLEFGRVGEPEITADHVLRVASLDDLLALKLKVIFQRIEAKDYRDIAAMIEAGISLERGLASAAALFGPSFSPSEALKVLVYFKGGDLESLSTGEKRWLIAAAGAVRSLPAVSIRSQSFTEN